MLLLLCFYLYYYYLNFIHFNLTSVFISQLKYYTISYNKMKNIKKKHYAHHMFQVTVVLFK